MKKGILLLTLVMAIFMVGCGNKDVKESNEPQTMNSEKTSNTETRNWDDYMTSIKEKSDRIKVSLENDELTQAEMNIKSQELYELWDGALNDMWSELKLSLSEEEFSKMQDEQHAWIAEKEKSVGEAGKEVEGGSMYSLIVNMEAAKITEERVYELYELLK